MEKVWDFISVKITFTLKFGSKIENKTLTSDAPFLSPSYHHLLYWAWKSNPVSVSLDQVEYLTRPCKKVVAPQFSAPCPWKQIHGPASLRNDKGFGKTLNVYPNGDIEEHGLSYPSDDINFIEEKDARRLRSRALKQIPDVLLGFAGNSGNKFWARDAKHGKTDLAGDAMR